MHVKEVTALMVLRNRDIDMCNGPLFGKILMFSLPIMAMNILQLLFNAIGMIVVGRFSGSEALGAVGATASLINLIITLFMGLSVGTSVIVAQDYGAGKPEEVSRSTHTSISVSIIGGIIVSAIGIVFCKPLLVIMGTPQDIIDLSVLYMRIYFIGTPATMVFNFAAAILRSIGDSRRPMYFLVAAGIVNIIFSLFFVVLLKLSVAGVAMAAVISQYLSFALIMISLIRSDKAIRLSPKRLLNIDKSKLLSLIRIGLPAGLQGLLFSISNVLIQSAVNSFGSTMVAASSAAGNVEGFVSMSMMAYYNAAIAFTGQNMGAKKYERIDIVAKVCTVLIFATWFLIGGLTWMFRRQLLSLYTTNPEVVELGMLRLSVMMAFYFTCGIMNVYPGLTRGMGYSILPMLCTLIGACLMRIIWLVTVFEWYPTEIMLFTCYPVTWALAGIGQIASFFYARRKIHQKVVPEAVTV
jgi:putative MATE family efflux protein